MLKEAAKIIKNSKKCIALTGAGISVESGIPDFRSSNGLWKKFDPMIYAYIDTFYKSPEMVYEMIFDMVDIIGKATPNPGHKALADLEKLGILKGLITQNIDNLHQEAGNKNVIEYHGNASMFECLKCGKKYYYKDLNILNKITPKCNKCDEILKPMVIFFGEAIPKSAMIDSQELAKNADTVLVIGTSAKVHPCAGIPIIAKNNGATIIEFNIEKTDLTYNITDIFIQGSAGKTLPKILKKIK
jgi:NAD-dependent protein deacetylase/lipoamidase